MPTLSSLLSALVLALLVGGAASAWLWKIRRARLVRDAGLRLLSAMRWREFSKLVVDGLGSRGFEPEGVEDGLERSQDAVLHLRREGQPWLLACKQGVQQHLTATQVGDMFDAVRFHGAAGGLLATTGTIEAGAQRLAHDRIELLDGSALWELVEPELAPGVRAELRENAREATVRHSILAWTGALALGLASAFAMPGTQDAVDAEPPAVSSPSPTGTRQATPAVVEIAAPISEDEQREEIIRLVSSLEGIDRVLWSTRSTLLVQLTREDLDPVEDVCAVMERYETLRTSRVHLQPPTGSRKPARFLQCRTF